MNRKDLGQFLCPFGLDGDQARSTRSVTSATIELPGSELGRDTAGQCDIDHGWIFGGLRKTAAAVLPTATGDLAVANAGTERGRRPAKSGVAIGAVAQSWGTFGRDALKTAAPTYAGTVAPDARTRPRRCSRAKVSVGFFIQDPAGLLVRRPADGARCSNNRSTERCRSRKVRRRPTFPQGRRTRRVQCAQIGRHAGFLPIERRLSGRGLDHALCRFASWETG